jgi:hypothetical protein
MKNQRKNPFGANFLFSLFVLGTLACSTSKPLKQRNQNADFDRKLADSLLTLGFDQEALYTLLSDMKPMSSICNLSLPLARKDSSGVDEAIVISKNISYLQQLERYQKVLDALETTDVGFIISPFKQDYDGKRIMQINVYRRSSVAKIVAERQAFFGQWGFVPSTEPEILINTIEYESKYERFRGYGYLFGYPKHAVDFFVEAAQSEARTKQFVKRDFFSIPVFIKRAGHFVYATPKGYKPVEIDSIIYRKAAVVLADYKKLRTQFMRPDSSLRALEMWKTVQKKK